jgi:hypothetical protein
VTARTRFCGVLRPLVAGGNGLVKERPVDAFWGHPGGGGLGPVWDPEPTIRAGWGGLGRITAGRHGNRETP